MIPMLDLQREMELYGESVHKAVDEVIDSGTYILGPKTATLEKWIAQYVEASHGIGVANGTDALIIALKALGIGRGDEVITTPFTFIATAEAIVHVGAKPVFVDIDPVSYLMDIGQIESAITKNTKAILIVHLYGKTAPMDQLVAIAKKHSLFIVEDACQAIGSEWNGRRVGAIGDIGCFSFFPSKNLSGFGDGGMIVTNSSELADRVRSFRNHGSVPTNKYIHERIGYNSRLDEMQAAILNEKVKYLDLFLAKRTELANQYTTKLQSLVTTPEVTTDRSHTFHQYCIYTKERDKLAKYLIDHNISTAIYYPIPIHLQQAFHPFGYKEGDFPVAETTAKHILALPIFPMLRNEEQMYIVEKVSGFFTRE